MVTQTILAHDDIGGAGRLIVMLPGAGDLRSEYRFVGGTLGTAGFRVVGADLPGHGESALASEYTVASTAAALIDLIEALDAGPAVVVACSFAPAAAVWASVDRPDLIDGIVAISPHLHADDSPKGRTLNRAIRLMLRGPWAAVVWAKLYRGWYKTSAPADLDTEIERIRDMLGEGGRRRAVRETLTASREGVEERIGRLAVPTLVVFGDEDDHFPDPVAAADDTARELEGEQLIVEGAGHYPHVEQPDLVAKEIAAFVERLG